MNILIASDIHASEIHLSAALDCAKKHKVGAIIFNGDLIPKTLYHNVTLAMAILLQKVYLSDSFVPRIKYWKEKHPDVQIYADFGNDDFWSNRDILLEAEKNGVLRLLHNRAQPLTSKIDIVGYMFVPPTPFLIKDAERKDLSAMPIDADLDRKGIFSVPDGLKMRYIDQNESIEEDLSKLEERINHPFILATHAPPYGLGLDVLLDGRAVGSHAIRAFIDREAAKGRLIAAFSGHIHESFEVSGRFANEVNSRPIVNAGQSDDLLRYVLFNSVTKRVTVKTSKF